MSISTYPIRRTTLQVDERNRCNAGTKGQMYVASWMHHVSGHRRVCHVPLKCIFLAVAMAGRGVANSLNSMATSPATVLITKSTSVPANVRQKIPEPLVFFDISGDKSSHPAVAGGVQ